MALRIFSTASGEKEEFVPRSRPVSMYVCGMTPKFHPHVGHAWLFVSMDVVRRYLRFAGYELRHVQNFTDVDDKIIARGQTEGISAAEAARKYTQSYFEDMDALGVQRADVMPKVTSSMPEIIAMISGLIGRGSAYEADGNVWFSVSTFPDYGRLSRRSDEDVLAGARVEVDPGKRDPRDFALWKRAKPGEPAWESPWGPGRPGWHIECSSMIFKELGPQIDIHAGGRDLIFPHHENEIAQSEAFTGRKPFVRYWMHVGLLTIGGEKMSHSLNNFLTIKDLLARYSPEMLRYYLVSQHYRTPIAYSVENLEAAGRGLERLEAAGRSLHDLLGRATRPDERDAEREAAGRLAEGARAARAAFVAGMDDDFNTPRALAALFDLVREVNRCHAAAGAGPIGAAVHEAAREAHDVFKELLDVLGIGLRRADVTREGLPPREWIEERIAQRNLHRNQRQFAAADAIRQELLERGIELRDGPGGTTWKPRG